MHYCADCDWRPRTDRDSDLTQDERNFQVISHHCETGHTVLEKAPPDETTFMDH